MSRTQKGWVHGLCDSVNDERRGGSHQLTPDTVRQRQVMPMCYHHPISIVISHADAVAGVGFHRRLSVFLSVCLSIRTISQKPMQLTRSPKLIQKCSTSMSPGNPLILRPRTRVTKTLPAWFLHSCEWLWTECWYGKPEVVMRMPKNGPKFRPMRRNGDDDAILRRIGSTTSTHRSVDRQKFGSGVTG